MNPTRRAAMYLGKRMARARDRRIVEAAGELPELLRAYTEKTRSTGCSWSDYAALYQQIRALRPREVLECGTGVSTLVLAYALAENAREGAPSGRVTSMEEHEGWYEMASGLLPDSLRDFVDLRLSPTEESHFWVFRGMRYSDVPDRPYGFVFVDGPATRAPSDGVRTCDLDLVHIVAAAKEPVSAVIDGRLSTCYVLQQLFGRRFRFDVRRSQGLLDACTGEDLAEPAESSRRYFKEQRRAFARTRFHPAE